MLKHYNQEIIQGFKEDYQFVCWLWSLVNSRLVRHGFHWADSYSSDTWSPRAGIFVVLGRLSSPPCHKFFKLLIYGLESTMLTLCICIIFYFTLNCLVLYWFLEKESSQFCSATHAVVWCTCSPSSLIRHVYVFVALCCIASYRVLSNFSHIFLLRYHWILCLLLVCK